MAPFLNWAAKVPEVFNALKHTGKSATNQQETPGTDFGGRRPPGDGRTFEVLFCGSVGVENNNTGPFLIDECAEQLGLAGRPAPVDKTAPKMSDGLGDLTASARLAAQIKLFFQPLSKGGAREKVSSAGEAGAASPPRGREAAYGLEENRTSQGQQQAGASRTGPAQPTAFLENRHVLLVIDPSQVRIASPERKKGSGEKRFSEISFCSQGTKRPDHFGFVCRDPDANSCHQLVCCVFQCSAEALAEEAALALKRAFPSGASQPPRDTIRSPQRCPLEQLNTLCKAIEGLHSTAAKLELQKHVATLESGQQAYVLESVLRTNPKTDQEENDAVVTVLRQLYQEGQNDHTFGRDSVFSQVTFDVGGPCEAQGTGYESRVEQRKPGAERDLSGSPEVIWKGSPTPWAKAGSNGEGEAESGSLTPPRRPSSSSSTSVSTSTQEFSSEVSLCASPSPPSPTDLLASSMGEWFRPRASTYSHPLPGRVPGPAGAPQQPTATIKPRILRHNSLSTDSPYHTCVAAPVDDGLPRSHGLPWRQQIFLRVAASQKPCDTPSGFTNGGAPLAEGVGPEARVAVEGRGSKRWPAARERWKKAILQQILLLRMERENQKLQASESHLKNKRLKLDYEEITPCLKEVTLVWEQMLGTPGRAKVQFDMEKIHSAVWQGVPRPRRGEIWKFLSEQHLLRHRVSSRSTARERETPYKDLLGQLTSQQHAILIDLGRTFPTHPYFSAKLGTGQLSLYNLLKAYSVLDPEVGYCQGLSFVAGVLLLHMDEEEAFDMLAFLMYDMGLRKQYRPDMIILQIQMYQLSRLLHDYHRELYSHLEKHEIGPSLYATPWFLTAFASHFPMGFVARVFDMLFLQGSEAIFKVALSLLGSHKPLIMQYNNLEAIVDFIKTTLPKLGLVQMEKTINQVLEMDLSKQLQAYEVEYHVLQDQLLDTPASTSLSQQQRMAQLEKANRCLRQQNLDLLEELQVAHGKMDALQANVVELLGREGRLRQEVEALQRERATLLETVAALQAAPQHPLPTLPC
ncbi:TBC1 domain family member 1-like isoform X1 [Scleropages formosus]|nr:TBC1 domain family member 1-like isoform X1 [Scleropages formosus]